MGYEKALARRRRAVRKWMLARHRAAKEMGATAFVGLLGRSACKVGLALLLLGGTIMFLRDGESIEEMMEITYICLAVGVVLLVAEYVLAKITITKGVATPRNPR